MLKAVIKNVDDWPRPKLDKQWKDDRSAKGLAERWFASGTAQCPPELIQLLDTDAATRNFTLQEGYPEHVTSLPERGEGRNHDLMLRGSADSGPLVVCIEAKVDEPFGPTIGEYLQTSVQNNERTRVPERTDALMGIVFGPQARADQEPWTSLRYQLLTAAAGCALEAARQNVATTVLVIHELQTANWNPKKGSANAADYARFVTALFPSTPPPITRNVLYGPLTLPASGPLTRDITLYIGKAVFP